MRLSRIAHACAFLSTRDLLCAALLSIAGSGLTPSISAAQSTAPILVDRHMTVGAGATVMPTIGEIVAGAENAVVPHRLFEEHGGTRRMGNAFYRTLRLLYFDLPQENLLLVANHEVFGHGARLRERFDGPISYHIDAPAPYGHGGGSTSFGLDREPSSAEWLAVSAAGMEVDGVSAGLIAHRAFADGRMGWRDAIRYIGFELDTLDYVLSTGDHPEEPGHDVSDFLQLYNIAAADAGAPMLQARTLRREAVVSLANPMLAYALFAIGRYIGTGAADMPVWTMTIAGARYLPYMRYRLTPFGTEWAVINELGGRLPPLQIEGRVGRSPNATPFGVSVRREAFATRRQWRVDADVDLWRQPPIDDEGFASITGGLRWGTQIRGRVERPLSRTWFGDTSLTVIVDVAVKTQGFVAGDPLGAGLWARAGIGIPLRR